MKCRLCNKRVLATSKFCTNCGAKLRDDKDTIDATNKEYLVDSQRTKYPKVMIILGILALLFITSTSTVIYKIITNKNYSLADTNKNQNNTVYNENPAIDEQSNSNETEIDSQEAISIALDAISTGWVKLGSDYAIKNGRIYYEIINYSDSESNNAKLHTMYIDNKTGEIYVQDNYNPENPWIRIENSISEVYNNQSSNTSNGSTSNSTTTPNESTWHISRSNENTSNDTTTRLSQGEYYAKLTGIWVKSDSDHIRTYAKEGYYVSIGSLPMVEGNFTVISDLTTMLDILEPYIAAGAMQPNVYTNPEVKTSPLQNMDINRFEDVVTTEDLYNAVIVDIENNIEIEEYKRVYDRNYKELIIFTSSDYKQYKTYILKEDGSMIIKEVGDFTKK